MQLDGKQAQRLFSLPGICHELSSAIPCRDRLQDLREVESGRVIEAISARITVFFDEELNKLEKWADDLKSGLEFELKELDREIKFLKTESKKILKLDEKLKARRRLRNWRRSEIPSGRNLFEAQDEIDGRKEGLIESVEARLKQLICTNELFTMRLRVV